MSAEHLTDWFLDKMTDTKTNPDTVFEALKLIIGCVAHDRLEWGDPAVNARLDDVVHAITELQDEIAGVITRKGLT